LTAAGPIGATWREQRARIEGVVKPSPADGATRPSTQAETSAIGAVRAARLGARDALKAAVDRGGAVPCRGGAASVVSLRAGQNGPEATGVHVCVAPMRRAVRAAGLVAAINAEALRGSTRRRCLGSKLRRCLREMGGAQEQREARPDRLPRGKRAIGARKMKLIDLR
jgi:hypothetical protein